MNKNDFMKAMSMIDEDLIKEADTDEIKMGLYDNAERFSNENESSTVVSGVEVYQRTIWKKILAVAATLVIAVGAAGGGIYYFSNLRNNNIIEESNDIISIYEEISLNKEQYDMTRYCRIIDQRDYAAILMFDEAKEAVFDTLDKEILPSGGEITKEEGNGESIKYYITDKGEENIYKFRYQFELFSNSVFELTERKDDGSEKKYRFKLNRTDMIGVLKLIDNEAFIESYDAESVCSNPEEASAEEVGELLEKLIDNNREGIYLDGKNESKCIMKDREKLKNTLLGYKWNKRTLYKKDEYFIDGESYYDVGVRIDPFYGLYDGSLEQPVLYSIDYDNMNDMERVLKESIEIVFESHDVDERDIIEIFGDAKTAKLYERSINCGYTVYNIADPDAFRKEVAALGWVTCFYTECEWGPSLSDAKGLWTDEKGYIIGDVAVGLKGYLRKSFFAQGDSSSFYYKLKNTDDVESFNQILDKYLAPNKYSELSIKESEGASSFSNLKAHYTYEHTSSYGPKSISLKGMILQDSANERKYVTAEGQYHHDVGTVHFDGMAEIELVEDMGRDDLSEINGFYKDDYGFYKVISKETGETIDVVGYSDFGNIRASLGFLYGQQCSEFSTYDDSGTKIDTGLYSKSLEELAFDVNNNNGKIEYHIHTLSDSGYDTEYWMVFTENYQLISYECISKDDEGGESHTVYRLDDYEFDSPDFTMDDVMPAFDRLKNEYMEKAENKN